MKKIHLLSIVCLALLTGCEPKKSSSIPAANPAATTYSTRGLVREIAADRRNALIKHEEIPGYMKAMTMKLSVRDTNELAGINPGDEITFKLMVTETEDWIEAVRFIAHRGLDTNATFNLRPPPASLNVGDALPDYEFLGEDGRTFRISDYRGSAVVFTFIFTTCPLPDFCPRMNRNLAAARTLLFTEQPALTNWQMLSLSFDPDVDKPPVLASYAQVYRGRDARQWKFAAAATNTLAGIAPQVGLNFWREGGSISHNLRTVVLDGDGKIFRQFDGNEWTAAELAAAVVAAARKP